MISNLYWSFVGAGTKSISHREMKPWSSPLFFSVVLVVNFKGLPPLQKVLEDYFPLRTAPCPLVSAYQIFSSWSAYRQGMLFLLLYKPKNPNIPKHCKLNMLTRLSSVTAPFGGDAHQLFSRSLFLRSQPTTLWVPCGYQHRHVLAGFNKKGNPPNQKSW